ICDRVGPFERGALAPLEPVKIRDPKVVREIPEAQLLDPLVYDAAFEHVLADVAPAFERARRERADLVGASANTLHQRSTLELARPAPGSADSSPWPTPHVLITRCCPNLSATEEPASTLRAAANC